MIVITLARKPTGSTVAANALKWGCGGLNIDQTRIGTADNLNGGTYASNPTTRTGTWTETRAGDQNVFRRGAAGEFVPPSGRFPANLILVHAAGCVCTGTTQIKGNRTDTRPEGDGGREDKSQWRIRPTDQTKRGYSDDSGKETVQAWDCEPGCPIAGLDEQTGLLNPSRFFKQVQE